MTFYEEALTGIWLKSIDRGQDICHLPQLRCQADVAESAPLLADDVLPHEPIHQWVLSFPFPLPFFLASYPDLMGKVLGIVQRVLATLRSPSESR
jgi:hypothetical protein